MASAPVKTLLIVIVTLISLHDTSVFAELRCPLVWKDYEVGLSLPNGTIPPFEGEESHFIIRGQDNDGNYHIGRHEVRKVGPSDDFVVFDDQVQENFVGHQMLTNPHGCDVRWEPSSTNPNRDFLVGGSETRPNIVVGRTELRHQYLGGEVDITANEITVVSNKTVYETSSTFEYLVSTSEGFSLEFTDLKFKADFAGTIEFLGIDEISNSGGATISQAITHTKKIIKATRFTHNGKWAHTSEATFNFPVDLKLEIGGVNLNSLGVNIYAVFGGKSLAAITKPASLGSEVTQDLTTTREIQVEAYTHIQACTLIGKINKFTNNAFTATGKYRAKGWTGKETFEYLSKQPNPPNVTEVVDADYAASTEAGTFSGELYLNNVMAILDRSMEGDCVTLKTLFTRLNKLQRDKSRGGPNKIQEEREIESKIANILAIKPKKHNN